MGGGTRKVLPRQRCVCVENVSAILKVGGGGGTF